MKRFETEIEIDKYLQDHPVEKAKSRNCKPYVYDSSVLLIVGTITPGDEEKNPYYYTSKNNRIYGYIDEALCHAEEQSLKSLKQNAIKNIDVIKGVLKKDKIGFLDVIKYAARKKGSPYDKDISGCVLDCDAFKDLKNVKTVICNSRLAYDCFLEIAKDNKWTVDDITNKEMTEIEKDGKRITVLYLSQRRATKERWVREIRKAAN